MIDHGRRARVRRLRSDSPREPLRSRVPQSLEDDRADSLRDLPAIAGHGRQLVSGCDLLHNIF